MFRDFGGLCEKATERYYRERWGLEVEESQLLENEELSAEEADREATTLACERFFGGGLSVLRPFTFGMEDLERAGDLAQARSEMQAELNARSKYFKAFNDADARYVAAIQAGAC